jgi:hypothetical protein
MVEIASDIPRKVFFRKLLPPNGYYAGEIAVGHIDNWSRKRYNEAKDGNQHV